MNILQSISVGLILFTPCLTSGHLLAEGMGAVNGYSIDEMEDRIRTGIEEVVQIVKPTYNSRVRSYLRTYIEYSPQQTEVMMGRAELYFDLFEMYLDQYDLPRDLKYLAVVESALVPGATSSSGAGGIWQFMRPTGREYGLRVTQYIDERRDPVKSTEAAVRYLQKLYQRFGTWELAMAAYNAGPGRVNSAIRRSGTKDYWKLSKYLPRETRSYVPGFIAVNYLFERYADHNLEPKRPADDLLHTTEIPVYDGISLLDVSKITGVSYQTIKLLNPVYSRRYIPRSSVGHMLRVPAYAIGVMQEHLGYPEHEEEMIAQAAPVFYRPGTTFIEETREYVHEVASGDNLYDLAAAYGCSVRKLMQWNGLSSAHLDIGQALRIQVKRRVAVAPTLEDLLIPQLPALPARDARVVVSADRPLPIAQLQTSSAQAAIVPEDYLVIRRRMSLRDAMQMAKSTHSLDAAVYNSALPGSVITFRK